LRGGTGEVGDKKAEREMVLQFLAHNYISAIFPTPEATPFQKSQNTQHP